MSLESPRKGLQSFGESLQAVSGMLPPELRDSAAPRTSKPLRATRMAAQWRTDMARAYSYNLERAKTPEEEERITAEYERTIEARPDFASYRRDSRFMDAPRHSIDRNGIARIKFKLQAIRRGTWNTKEKGKHSGGIPHSVMEVFDAIAHLVLKHGQVFPSLVGLGILATRSKQTVVNAIKTLEFYGVVTRIRRIKRIRTAMGRKIVQDTNAYTLQEPNMLGEAAYRLFGGGSESRNQAARKPDSYSIDRKRENSRRPDRGGGFFDQLREQWDCS